MLTEAIVRQMRLSQIVKWGTFYRNHWHCNIEKDIMMIHKKGYVHTWNHQRMLYIKMVMVMVTVLDNNRNLNGNWYSSGNSTCSSWLSYKVCTEEEKVKNVKDRKFEKCSLFTHKSVRCEHNLCHWAIYSWIIMDFTLSETSKGEKNHCFTMDLHFE